MAKGKMSVMVRDTLIARCILEYADREGNKRTYELANSLFNSLFEKLTPDQRNEYDRVVAEARAERVEKFVAEGTSAHGLH